MTSPPSPPNRRRRLVVVTAIAVIAVGLCWWAWPSYPRDLIGSWRSEKGFYGIEPDEPEYAVTLNADGTGLMTSNGSQDVPFYWIVEGPVVVIAIGQRPGLMGKLDQQIERYFPAPMLSDLSLVDARWYVERISRDELKWTLLAAGETTPSARSLQVWNLMRVK